jgi:hypothetical protein
LILDTFGWLKSYSRAISTADLRPDKTLLTISSRFFSFSLLRKLVYALILRLGKIRTADACS